MRCPRCGHENAQTSLFCRFCGKKLTAAKPAKSKSSNPAKKALVPVGDGKPQSSGAAAKPKKRRRVKWGAIVLLSALGVLLAGGSAAAYEFWKAWSTLPPVSNMVAMNKAGQNSTVYDRFGKKVATLHLFSNRIVVPINQISPNIQHALVSIEDHNFYHNEGFDFASIVRAALVDLTHHAALQGASTITEQLAKDLYLSDQKTLVRKIQEFIIGLELARTYSKPQILDMYLNEVYLGNGAYGIGAATKAYFNETPSQVTLAQAAILAGLPQAPSAYDPLVNMKSAKARQLQVLQAMVKWGYISSAQAKKAYQAPLHLRPTTIASSKSKQMYPYPWYIDQVVKVLERHGFTQKQIFDGGLKIYTALDPTVYNIAQNAVDYWMNYNFGVSPRTNPYHQAATVVENPHNGYVYADIGGRTHVGAFPLNLATARPGSHGFSGRSTGSSIKPLLEYTPAIAKGMTQMSVIQDVPIFQNVGGQHWWPHNDNLLYRGYITLRDALAISDNDVAVHLLHNIGLNYGFNFAVNKFGLPLTQKDRNAGIGIAIGGLPNGVNVLNMTQAYSTFPNNGVRMSPIWVTKVVGPNGGTVFQDTPHGHTEFSSQVAYTMTKMMERVLYPHMLPSIGPNAYPTGVSLGIGRPAAGKTGTQNGEADAWFIGYEPQLTVGVWEGNRLGEIPQPSTVSGKGPAYGDVAAGPIWQTIMQKVNAAENIPAQHFTRPSGMVYVPNVSITSGLIAGPYTPSNQIQGAWFINGTQPTTIGHTHSQVKVTATNPPQLWHQGCGPAVTSVFLKPESDWHSGVPLPWDHIYWAPTKNCNPSSFSSSSSSSSSSSTTSITISPSSSSSSSSSSIPSNPVSSSSPPSSP